MTQLLLALAITVALPWLIVAACVAYMRRKQ